MKREHRLGAIQMRVSAMERRGSQVKEEVEEKEQGGQSWGWGGEWGREGAQVPQKSRRGCSTLAAHYGSSQVNVKTRESFAEYRFNAAAREGGRCVLQITCALFPTHTKPGVPPFPHSRKPQRDTERMLFYVALPSVKSNCGKNQCGKRKKRK